MKAVRPVDAVADAPESTRIRPTGSAARGGFDVVVRFHTPPLNPLDNLTEGQQDSAASA
jgi:hypothetical protein